MTVLKSLPQRKKREEGGCGRFVKLVGGMHGILNASEKGSIFMLAMI